MKIGLILNDYDINTCFNDYDYLIGVDRGAYLAYKNGIRLDLAIGDFDSISFSEYNQLSQAVKVIKLNPIKDLTDTAQAVEYALSISNDITIFGGIEGNRVEHFIANLCLFNKCNHLKIVNKYSNIYVISDKKEFISNEYKFYSFFYFEGNPIISLKGFKYELNNYFLKPYDSLCISNELLGKGNIEIKNGKIIVIESKNDQN